MPSFGLFVIDVLTAMYPPQLRSPDGALNRGVRLSLPSSTEEETDATLAHPMHPMGEGPGVRARGEESILTLPVHQTLIKLPLSSCGLASTTG